MQEFIGLVVYISLAVVLVFVLIACERFIQVVCGRKVKRVLEQKVDGVSLDRFIRYDSKYLIFGLFFVLAFVSMGLVLPVLVKCVKAEVLPFIQVGVFVFILILTLIYALGKNILKWR